MHTTEYQVTGMTCEHCVAAVTEGLTALPQVRSVEVNLVADGVSTVQVTSDAALEPSEVAAALDEAGDYQLA